MFDLEAALSRLNGQRYTFEELREEMTKIRLSHIEELSPELSVNDLMRLALLKGWIQEDSYGEMTVETTSPVLQA